MKLRDQGMSGESPLDDLGILQSPGSAEFKGQTQQLNQMFSGVAPQICDLHLARDPGLSLSFLPGGVGNTWY